MKVLALLIGLCLCSCGRVNLEPCQVMGSGRMKNVSNCRFISNKNEIKYNDRGFITDSRATAVQGVKQPKRIIVLGGRFVSGEMMGPELRLTNQLEKIFEKESGKEYEVFNVGVRGGGAKYFEENIEELLEYYNPQMVFMIIDPKVIIADYLSDINFVDTCPLKLIIDFNSSNAPDKLTKGTLDSLDVLRHKIQQKGIGSYFFWTAGGIRVDEFLVDIKGCGLVKNFISERLVEYQDFLTLHEIRKSPVISSSKFRDTFQEVRKISGTAEEKTKRYYEKMARVIHEEFKKELADTTF